MAKQLSVEEYQKLTKLEKQTDRVCGGFKFKTNIEPKFCPQCGRDTLLLVGVGVYVCTSCGSVNRTESGQE